MAVNALAALNQDFTDLQAMGKELLCFIQNAGTSIPFIIKKLTETGIGVREIAINAPTLDDVFIKATGGRLKVQDEANERTKGAK